MGGKRGRSTLSPIERITEDGILYSIISSLKLRDRVRTCVLSSRWRHIWTHVPYLHFDAVNVCLHGMDEEETTDKFIGVVDSVLQQRRQGARLEALTVTYFLHKIHSHKLDVWVRFGVASKIKILILNLLPVYGIHLPSTEPYDFPCELFAKHNGGSTLEQLFLRFCSLKPPHGFDGLNNLKELDLFHVDVTEEGVKQLLSNCFSLERLCVHSSQQLVTLNVSHPLSQLKHLKVRYCDLLRKIEIDAENLTSLDYAGRPVDFIFTESSRMAEADINFVTGKIFNDMDFDLTKLSSNLPHLKSLFLQTKGFFQVADLPKISNNFIQLRHFVWTVNYVTNKNAGLLCLAALLDAAPMLEKFDLLCQTIPVGGQRQLRKIRRLPKKSDHNHLKTVEITGFLGDRWQIEFVMHLLNCAIELESITLDPRVRNCYGSDEWDISESFKKIPETVKKYLWRGAQSNAKLVIL